MNRKYVWLSVCVTVLLLSFLIPWIVLLIMENNALGKDEYLKVSGELLDYGELSLARKQQLLEGGELIVSLDSTSDAREQQDCIEGFREQIGILVDGGALPEFMLELAQEPYTVRAYLALHAQSNEAFRYYELSNGSNIRCYYDGEQKKILAIQLRYLTDLYIEYLYGLPTQNVEAALSQQLRAWANYYDHAADEICVDSIEVISADQTQLVRSSFSQGEISYGFGLFLDLEKEALIWGITSPSEQQAAEEAVG